MNQNNLFTLFSIASKNGLQYPSVSFVEKGYKIRLYKAKAGYIGIKCDGEYIGRADLFPAAIQTECKTIFDLRMYSHQKDLYDVIDQFILNPAENAIIKGKQTGSCCFCGRFLENAASVYWGYGPICAEHYGLPHELPSTFDLLNELNEGDL